MPSVALVGLVDERGWLLLQERDEHAPTDPERWSLVGGGIETGEAPAAAAVRELAEETGLTGMPLLALGARDVACREHGTDHVHLYAARTTATDADVVCGEGRRIVFVDPARVGALDLTDATRATWTEVLSSCSR